MTFRTRDANLRSPVSTYSLLPLTENVQGDIRIAEDIGVAYSWMIESSSGQLTDWKKLTVSNYSDLSGAPLAQPVDIDNTVEMTPSLSLNVFLLGALNYFAQAGKILKLFDGVFDRYGTDEGIDLTASQNIFKNTASLAFVNPYLAGWVQCIRGTKPLDLNTRMYIDCRSVVDINGNGFVDSIRNSWANENVTLDTSIKKFGAASFYFNGTNAGFGGEMDFVRYKVENKDFSYDFWMYPRSTGNQVILNDAAITIKKDSNEKLSAEIKCANYGEFNPVINTLTAVSTSSLSLNTWTHVAVQRRNGYLEVYINGVLENTSATADNNALFIDNGIWYTLTPYPNSLFVIGGTINRTNYFHGNLDEIRYSYNVTRYTGNFTPETVAYNSSLTEVQSIVVSNLFSANDVPSSARVVVAFEEIYDVLTPNIDIQAFVSRDGGTTWTACVIGKVTGIVVPRSQFFTGIVDLSDQPEGKLMRYKIIINNNKDLHLYGAGLSWK